MKIIDSEIKTITTKTKDTGTITERPEALEGQTIKITPSISPSIYITVNHDQTGKPAEFFFNTKNTKLASTLALLGTLLSATAKREDPKFAIQELTEHQAEIGYHHKGKFYASEIAHIGNILLSHLYKDRIQGEPELCLNCE